jgi:hypothetical protein
VGASFATPRPRPRPLPARARRDAVAAELGVPPSELELSMGMSGDYEAAVGGARGVDGLTGGFDRRV